MNQTNGANEQATMIKHFFRTLIYLDMNYWGSQGREEKVVGERKTSYYNNVEYQL